MARMAAAGTDMAGKTAWLRWAPGLQTVRAYRLNWLGHDLIAGTVLAAILAPVGVAYAVASGAPGVCGLYATIAALLAYALFGPSRILVLGPDSSLAALILGVISPLAAGDPAHAVALASALAIVSGCVCILAGVARLGFITELLSKPIRYGYMNGIALTVMVSQLPEFLGLSAQGDGLIERISSTAVALAQGKINGASLAIGAGALGLILALRRCKRIPGVLIAVAAATLAVGGLGLDTSAGVSVLGALPQGLPIPALPILRADEILPVIAGGFAVAMVSFADTSVLSRAYAARLQQKVDPNQEMVGLGAANLAAGFFQGFPISSSSSRTPVAEAAGARTQLTSVVGALGLAALLVLAPDLLAHLPKSALAAVVIAAAIGLVEVKDLARIYRIQQWEFWLSMACFAGVAALGAIPGICLAVILAVIEFLWDGWRPHFAILGREDGLRGFHDIRRHPEARQIPGLVLLRWDAPLFFANAEFFREQALAAVAQATTPARWLVIAAEPVTSVDVTAADALADLDKALRDAGVELCFAELKGPVKDKLKRFGLFAQIGEPSFYPTIGAAVAAYLDSHDVDWDRSPDAPLVTSCENRRSAHSGPSSA